MINKTKIDANIKDLKKAEKEYSDAVAKGYKAVLMKEDKKTEMYELDVGNVLPGEIIKVMVVIIKVVDVEDGAYQLNIPKAYFPRYEKMAEV